jgi:replication factor C subunit 1
MDEVDGMSSGDRGGIQALIEVIKKTKIPIICIANDRQSPKLKSLANHCYDLKFNKPNTKASVKRLKLIATKEHCEIDENALANIVESNGSDLR